MNKFFIFIILIILSFEQESNSINIENNTNSNNKTEIINITLINNITEVNNSSETNNATKESNSNETINLSESNNSTQSNNFTETNNLTQTNNSTETNNLTQTNNSTETNNLTQSNNFTETNNLAQTNIFAETNNLTQSNNFTETNNLTQTNNFTETNNLTQTNNFTETNNLTQSNNFTETNNLTQSNNFTETNNLTETNNFTETNNLTQTNIFAETNNLTQTKNFTETNNSTQSNNFTETNNLTQTNNFTETNNLTEINNITQTNSENLPTIEGVTEILNITKIKYSKHYEDCFNTSECKKGLICKNYRCLTNFEIDNLELLGLSDKNVCDDSIKCLFGKKCLKHRCVVNYTQLDVPRKKGINDTSINLLFAGSIFLNNKAYKSGEKNNSFNYHHLFKNIKDDIKKADLAVVDQETVFHIDKSKFKKRVANTPKELGDAIAKAGFKLVLHGTIYAYSKEEKGIKNTLKFWKEKYPYIHTLGISKNIKDSENDYYIFKKKGIKIGIINFSGFPDLIPKEKEHMVNVISIKKIEYYVKKLKNETDFIIVCMNWGDKNSNSPNEDQIKWAKELTGQGVNLIIGNHPSFVQPVSYIRSKGKKALVFWSLGHLISDSNLENSFLGALANIVISKGKKGKAFISYYNLIPIINHKVNTTDYSVYKLSKYSQELGLKTSNEFSMDNVIEECTKIMGPFIK